MKQQDLQPSAADSPLLSRFPTTCLSLLLHCLSCSLSLILGFHFSHLFLFLLSSPQPSPSISLSSPNFSLFSPQPSPSISLSSQPPPPSTPLSSPPSPSLSPSSPPSPPSISLSSIPISPPFLSPPPPPPPSYVAPGRHEILIRANPHPLPNQTAHAYRILARVQHEQRAHFGPKSPRRVLAVTPTFVRTFQSLYLLSVMQSLMVIPYDVTWVVVEAGGTTRETAAILARSNLTTMHLSFEGKMPADWIERGRVEARMRLQALRMIRERRLEGIVAFVDESNIYGSEFFDEIQSVKWMGVLSLGILHNPGHAETQENKPLPVHGPACDSSGSMIGWHVFNDQVAKVQDLEWAGFVMDARILWEDKGGRPDWVVDLVMVVDGEGEEIKSPMVLVKDAKFVEPLGECGRKVMVWWMRAEARADSRFPPGWTLEAPLEITVPWKHTPWPEKSTLDPTISSRPTKKRRSSRKTKRREEREPPQG